MIYYGCILEAKGNFMGKIEYSRWVIDSVKEALGIFRVVAIYGARQCGKTTLARQLAIPGSEIRSLDNSAMCRVANEDPAGFISKKKSHLLIIDEVQKAPVLFPEIKLVVDENTEKGQYLLTGSANIRELPSVTESLAGRMGTIRLRPLAHGEIAGNEPTFLKRAFAGDFSATVEGYSKADVLELAFAGGYGETLEMSSRVKKIWFKSYLDSLLLHDIRELMDVRSYQILRKMMEALLGRSAKFVDATEFTSAFGIKHETFSRYISILKTLYLIDEVEAWHGTDYDGLGKRSKYFAADTGMMASLLDWNIDKVNFDSDRAGKIIETWVYQQLASQIDLNPDYTISQFRDKQKREIDFLITADDGNMLGVEVKSGSDVSKSDFKHLAWFRDNMSRDSAFIGIVLYTGATTLPFGKDLYAVPIGDICQ